ncbi:MAG: glycosyltransferase family 2 protein [Gloeomargarita sp. SRBZ-1_bins_9]
MAIEQVWEQPECYDPAPRDFNRYGQGRRRKAVVVLSLVWGGTIALHWVSWGPWVVWLLTTVMGLQALRLLWAKGSPAPPPTLEEDADLPRVSLLVAAKNEEAVIERLVRSLGQLDYPDYELWVIDDGSTDGTGRILDQLCAEYPQLRVLHRPAGAGGGKSGALNDGLRLSRGEIIGVFDADAQVPPDLLRWIVPLFRQPHIGAVQVRKAIAPGPKNWWLRGQQIEMVLDAFLQQQRRRLGGVAELRGNGQFVRRSALLRVGGWNEGTLTDDLDLTFRLHLDAWDIEFLFTPSVLEEGVTNFRALWHQRNRWAEGGYQRYLDYWRPWLFWPWGGVKRWDTGVSYLSQYLLPAATIPDGLMALWTKHPPLLWPLTGVMLLLFCGSTWRGLAQLEGKTYSRWRLLGASLRMMVYMLHWLPVVATMMVRVAVRPKRLKWVKTVHVQYTVEP